MIKKHKKKIIGIGIYLFLMVLSVGVLIYARNQAEILEELNRIHEENQILLAEQREDQKIQNIETRERHVKWEAALLETEEMLDREIPMLRLKTDEVSVELEKVEGELKIIEQQFSEVLLEAENYKVNLSTQLEMVSNLYQLNFYPIYSYYDVDRFTSSAKTTDLNRFLGTVTGFLGRMIFNAEDHERAMRMHYGSRREFNIKTMHSLQKAIDNLAAAIAAFNGSYETYIKMTEAINDREIVHNMTLLKHSGADNKADFMAAETFDLLNALAQYRFQLKVYFDMYTMLLNDEEYLGNISSQLDEIDELLAYYDLGDAIGYSHNEKVEVLTELLGAYRQQVINMENSLHSLSEPARYQNISFPKICNFSDAVRTNHFYNINQKLMIRGSGYYYEGVGIYPERD